MTCPKCGAVYPRDGRRKGWSLIALGCGVVLWNLFGGGLFGALWDAFFFGLPSFIMGARLLSKNPLCPSCTPDITPRPL